jgi:hypothetical protein
MTRLLVAALGVAALTLQGCGPPPEAGTCYTESDEVLPDDYVNGTRVGDLLEPYFGIHSGTLTWQTGTTTEFSLDVRYEAGSQYMLGNIHECEPKNVHYWSPAWLLSGDRAFDNEVMVGIGRHFPSAASGAIPRSVTSFNAFVDWQWNELLPERLGVNLQRYGSAYLLFELDWPFEMTSPTAGTLTFRGALADSPDISDDILVGTLTFPGQGATPPE